MSLKRGRTGINQNSTPPYTLLVFCLGVLLFAPSAFGQGDAGSWYERGNKLLMMGVFDEGMCLDAVDSYKQAIRLKPDFADAHIGLCQAYNYLNKYREAVDACKEAIRLMPNNHNGYVWLGIVYSDNKKHDDAVDSYKQAIRLKPDDAFAHYNLGLSYAQSGKKDLALEEYRILQKLDKRRADKLFRRINP